MRSTAIFLVSAGVAIAACGSVSAQNAPPLQSQPVAPDGRLPRFETAVVSENTSGLPPRGGTRLDARGYFSAAKVTLRQLIQTAYRRHALDRRLIEGGPEWMDSELFNIDAKAAGEHSLDPDGVPRQSLLMVRTLLAEQFKLTVRTEVREMPVYALVLARSDGMLGPRLRRSDVDCAEAVALMIKGQRPRANCGFQEYVGRYLPSVLTLPDLAAIFSEFVDRPVIDRTGLSGHYFASLEGAEVRAPGPFDAGYRPADTTREMFTALPAELGLKLEATTGPVEVLVIDGVANPNKPDPLPLVVERAEVLPSDAVTRGSDRISVSVHNTTDKTIVAWGVRTQVTFADGKTNSGGLSSDGYESRGLERRDSHVIPADGRHTIALSGFPSNRTAEDVRTVTARTTFVIFDDDTALGDERIIGFHFAKRAENQRAWPIIEKVFADALARTSDPHEALIAAAEGLDAITDEEIRRANAYTGTRHNLTNNLRITRPTRAAAALLTRLVDETRLRRAAADAHYQRRPLR
jgi:uncharacterized protein (TIGR03435 family)